MLENLRKSKKTFETKPLEGKSSEVKLSEEQVSKAFSKTRMVVPFRGKSMWPLLQTGDELVCEVYKDPQLIGWQNMADLVLHRDSDEWTVHRVIERNQRIVLKGDFSNSYFYSDEPVVWGRVIAVWKDGERKVLRNNQRAVRIAELSALTLGAQGIRRKIIKMKISFYGFMNRLLK